MIKIIKKYKSDTCKSIGFSYIYAYCQNRMDNILFRVFILEKESFFKLPNGVHEEDHLSFSPD